jgi:hypothetical protein
MIGISGYVDPIAISKRQEKTNVIGHFSGRERGTAGLSVLQTWTKNEGPAGHIRVQGLNDLTKSTRLLHQRALWLPIVAERSFVVCCAPLSSSEAQTLTYGEIHSEHPQKRQRSYSFETARRGRQAAAVSPPYTGFRQK